MTWQPALSSGTANSAATPCGSARNTTSACLASSSAFGSVKRSVLACGWLANFGKNLRQRLPGILARGHGDQFRVRMGQQQPHQFLAGITGGADNGDFFSFHFQKFNHESREPHENLSAAPFCYSHPPLMEEDEN